MIIKKVKLKKLFEVWKENKINPPKAIEIKEALAIFKKITDPAYKGVLPYFTIAAPMQSGKTQIMIGLACLWLDREDKAKAFISTSYTSTAHVEGLSNAVNKMGAVDPRFQKLLSFYKPNKMSGLINQLRKQDLVLFDEDQYGTSPKAQTRYITLAKELKDIGCTFGTVGATNISILDASSDVDVVYHKIEPNGFYRGVPHLFKNINDKKTKFVPYGKYNTNHIMQELAKHSNNTEKERFGVYIVRLKPRNTMEEALNMLKDWGMPIVICMGDGSNKVKLNEEDYNAGLEMIGLGDADKKDISLTRIIKKTFEYSKLNSKDVTLFIDGSLGCGVNLDKLVDKDLFPAQKYGEFTDLFHQNKPFIKGIVESSKVVTSLLQGLLGRLCRYVDTDGKYNEYLDELFEQMFTSFDYETAKLGIQILENPKDFQQNPQKYLSIANELDVKLYSEFDDDYTYESDFSEGIEIDENSIKSFNFYEALKDVEDNPSVIQSIIDGWKHIKPVVVHEGKVPQSHPANHVCSFSTYEYNQKQIGPYTKFNFQNTKPHDEKPMYGVGIDKKEGRMRLYKKGKFVRNYSNIESLKNTGHAILFEN